MAASGRCLRWAGAGRGAGAAGLPACPPWAGILASQPCPGTPPTKGCPAPSGPSLPLGLSWGVWKLHSAVFRQLRLYSSLTLHAQESPHHTHCCPRQGPRSLGEVLGWCVALAVPSQRAVNLGEAGWEGLMSHQACVAPLQGSLWCVCDGKPSAFHSISASSGILMR